MNRTLHAGTCTTTPSAMCFWALALGVLLAAWLPALEHYRNTTLLAALWAACFVNFGRNRTLHCRSHRPPVPGRR